MGWISLLAFFLEEALVNLKRHLVATVATVSTVALTVGLWTAFRSVSRGTDALLLWEGKKLTTVRVGLKPSVTEEQGKGLAERVQKLPFVEHVRFLHKDEALSLLQKAYGNSAAFRDLIGHNPLPHALVVTCRSPADVPRCSKFLSNLPEVDWISHHPQAVARFLSIVHWVSLVGLILSLVLGVIAFALIHNDIQITVYGRRNEIRIMQLVGATVWTVRGPLIMEGLLYGLSGSAVAVLLLCGGIGLAIPRVPLGLLQGLLSSCQLTGGEALKVIGMGALLGGVSALMASLRLVRAV